MFVSLSKDPVEKKGCENAEERRRKITQLPPSFFMIYTDYLKSTPVVLASRFSESNCYRSLKICILSLPTFLKY